MVGTLRFAHPTISRSVLASSDNNTGGRPMAKKTSKKTKSRSAAQATVKKRSGAKAVARSSARKAVKAKARTTPAKAAPKKPARPKQRIAISHHREEDFKADGLRAYAKY